MTLKKYLWLMSGVAIICWIGFLSVINYINPESTGLRGYLLFYASIFLATVSTLSVFGFILRSRILRGELAFRQVAITFRQAFWFGILIVISLWLQSNNLLSWWNLLIFIITLTVLEFFFLSLKKRS